MEERKKQLWNELYIRDSTRMPVERVGPVKNVKMEELVKLMLDIGDGCLWVKNVAFNRHIVAAETDFLLQQPLRQEEKHGFHLLGRTNSDQASRYLGDQRRRTRRRQCPCPPHLAVPCERNKDWYSMWSQ